MKRWSDINIQNAHIDKEEERERDKKKKIMADYCKKRKVRSDQQETGGNVRDDVPGQTHKQNI